MANTKTPEELEKDRGSVFIIGVAAGTVLVLVAAFMAASDNKKAPSLPAVVIAHDVVCFDSWGTSKRFPDVIRATHTAGAWDMEYAARERGVYVQLAGETCWYEVEKRADNTAHKPVIQSQTP